MAAYVIKKFFNDMDIGSSGREVGYIITRDRNKISGYVRQIIFVRTSGSATSLSDIQIRYFSGDSSLNTLVYKNTSVSISSGSYTDSAIDAPFNLNNVDDEDGLILYVQTDSTSTFDIRVDIEVLA